jgi:WD40 repeat protein
MWDELCDLLLDLDYLQARLGVLTAEQRVAPTTVYDVLRDYLTALQDLPARHHWRAEVERLYRALDCNAHVLREHPHLLLQQVANASGWEGTALERMSAAVRASPWPLLHLLNRPVGERDSALLRTFAGHIDRVWSVAFSPDGKHIVSGSWDRTVKVWDAQTGQQALSLEGHTNAVLSVCFSPDGKRLVSGSGDWTLKVWDAQTGQQVLELKGHTGLIWSVAFSADGKRITSGSSDQTVKVWDAQTGQQVLELNGHTSGVSSVSFSADGKRIGSGSSDQTVKVWDAQTGQQVLELKGHTGEVRSVAFSLDGRTIASGSDDWTVRLWDAVTGDLIAWRPFQGAIRSLWFHPKAQQLSVADDGGMAGRPRVYLLEIIRPHSSRP